MCGCHYSTEVSFYLSGSQVTSPNCMRVVHTSTAYGPGVIYSAACRQVLFSPWNSIGSGGIVPILCGPLLVLLLGFPCPGLDFLGYSARAFTIRPIPPTTSPDHTRSPFVPRSRWRGSVPSRCSLRIRFAGAQCLWMIVILH